MSTPAAGKTPASERLLVEIQALTKQNEELHRLMIVQHTTIMSELEVIKEKVANVSTKKAASRTGGARAASVPTPSGNKKYNNKMLWWKDTFAANYEQYCTEFFNEALESQDLLAEAEADFNESKNKDKEGVAKYKIMADYIWKNYLKTDKKTDDDKKAFRDAVFKKYDDYNLESGNAVEATAETGDDAEPNVAATEDDDAPNDNADGDADADDDEEEKPKKSAKATPVKKAAAPKAAAKAAPKAAAKGAAKPAAKGAAKPAAKTAKK